LFNNRTNALKLLYKELAVTGILALGASSKAFPQEAATDAKNGPVQKVKNVVVILADDHALKVTGCYGNKIVRTPNIDKLSSQGITFTRAYCNSPISSASRQSLLTGKYPHATGVNLLFTPFSDEGNTTIAEHLLAQGYKTGLVGKTHFNNHLWFSLYNNGIPKHGFSHMLEMGQYNAFLKKNLPSVIPDGVETYKKQNLENIPEWMNSRCLPHPVTDSLSEGTFMATEAVRYMRENKEKPFFLWVAFHQPHHPYYFPLEYRGKYKPEDMPLPAGSPEDDRWIPERFRNLTDDQRRGIIASYYTSVEYLDKNIGLVLDGIKANGLDENTLVIYLSDNGYLLNEHKRFEKHTMWEEANQQPMIFRLPGNKSAGARNDAVVEYVDVVPTILELTGNPELTEVQGKSFVDVLNSKASAFRDYAFSEYLQDNTAMVVKGDWKYVFFTGSRDLGIGYKTGFSPSGIVHRLYNLKNDPSESTNVAGKPENKALLEEMQQVMLGHFMKTHPDAARCPKELTTEGKLVWFCEPRDVGADQALEDAPVRVFKP
jgi:arylsulfatase A-like enzyme